MRQIILAATLLLSAHAQAAPIINLVPSSTVLGFNQSFTVDVLVSGVEALDPLLAFGFDVNAESGLSFTGATVAAPFFDDSAFFPTTDVAGSVFPAVSGDDILLGSLQLSTGSTEGMWAVAIGTSAGDLGVSEGLFTLLGTTDIAGRVAVEVKRGMQLGPAPGTLLLDLAGLLGVRFAGYNERAIARNSASDSTSR
ncbi:MAG: hypothetical protein Hals2KO_16850 [Halioglobus sp.]